MKNVYGISSEDYTLVISEAIEYDDIKQGKPAKIFDLFGNIIATNAYDGYNFQILNKNLDKKELVDAIIQIALKRLQSPRHIKRLIWGSYIFIYDNHKLVDVEARYKLEQNNDVLEIIALMKAVDPIHSMQKLKIFW